MVRAFLEGPDVSNSLNPPSWARFFPFTDPNSVQSGKPAVTHEIVQGINHKYC